MATSPTQLEKTPAVVPGGMTANAAALWTRSRIWWAGMQPSQRRGTLIAAGLLIALLGGLAWYGLRTDWRTLYAGMDPDEARETGVTLTQAQIPFEVAENGTATAGSRGAAGQGAPGDGGQGRRVNSGRMGFELFDKPNWVGSEFDEQVNYQRALVPGRNVNESPSGPRGRDRRHGLGQRSGRRRLDRRRARWPPAVCAARSGRAWQHREPRQRRMDGRNGLRRARWFGLSRRARSAS